MGGNMTEKEPKKRPMPHFDSIEEAGDFFDEYNPDEFESESADDIVLAIKPERKEQITTRLEPSLIRALKSVAEEFGLPYQTLLRGLVRRGIEELQRSGRPQ